ncbi:MAG: hypothetical protein DMD60_08220 [Gemmatimonadetes bacterium]|nr:MAG: hypothetical protein DMD60_08220 [Gemmatimonadota bacterium]
MSAGTGESARRRVTSRRHDDATPPARRQGLACRTGGEDLGGVSDVTKDFVVVGISGSPSTTSKSRLLVEYALGRLAARGATIQLVDLAALPAEPLLGRGTGPEVTRALEAATRAQIIVAGTPVYRATYNPPRHMSKPTTWRAARCSRSPTTPMITSNSVVATFATSLPGPAILRTERSVL